LQNVVERAVILCDEEPFCVDPSWLTRVTAKFPMSTVPLVADLAEREKIAIEIALREAILAGNFMLHMSTVFRWPTAARRAM
jgi:hypothetical protein